MRRRARNAIRFASALPTAITLAGPALGWGFGVDADETVTFFPTAGYRANGGDWVLPIHGWIYEAEDRSRQLEKLRRRLKLDSAVDESGQSVLARRAAMFLVDNERWQRVNVSLAGQVHRLPASGADGHFFGEIRVAETTIGRALRDRASQPSWKTSGAQLCYYAQLKRDDAREFTGRVLLVEPRGVSVISDIDDTIKITEVGSRQALLRRTFLEGFEAVPEIAQRYQSWAKSEGVQFHYVSASPWQLGPALEEFLQQEGFPAGSLHLRYFRIRWRNLHRIAEPSEARKRAHIRALLERYPKRRFVLVGDTAERDPEIYGDFAREFPDRISAIWLRNHSGESPDNDRCKQALAGVPGQRWRLFNTADELPYSLDRALHAESPTTQPPEREDADAARQAGGSE